MHFVGPGDVGGGDTQLPCGLRGALPASAHRAHAPPTPVAATASPRLRSSSRPWSALDLHDHTERASASLPSMDPSTQKPSKWGPR